jgi:hypothetical protein
VASLKGWYIFQEPGQDLDYPTFQSRRILIPISVSMDEENPYPESWDDGPGGEEEKVEETEDDYAPLPPEMIAASFEAAKPKSIKDNDDVSVPTEKIASPFKGHGDEDGEPDEDEDDYAPLPPAMMAVSFEATKPKLIKGNDYASVLPEQIALPFEGHGDEEEKVEETEDDYAPLPPDIIAASYEAAKPRLIEDYVNASVLTEQNASPFKRLVDEEAKAEEAEDDYAPLPPEMTAASTRPLLRIGPNKQPTPLLEAILVEDKPNEPVYDAIRIDPTQKDHAHGWSRKFQKLYRFITLGFLSITVASIIAIVVVASSGNQEQEIELVSASVIVCMLASLCEQGVASDFESLVRSHLLFSPNPPLLPRLGNNKARPMLVTYLDGQWLYSSSS